MSHVKGKDRKQMIFLPTSVDEYVSENNPVRVIDAFVDILDLKALGFDKAVPARTGRPAYAPADLLKLYIYGYMNKIRSSRKLMTECRRNIELFFLLNELKPDFRTISDFRKNNPEPIREVFREFVKLCDEFGLYKKELIAIDGTKVRAQNANDKCYNKETLVKKIARIDAHIEEYMGAIEKNDESGEDDDGEDDRPGSPGETGKTAETLKNLSLRREKYAGYLEHLENSSDTQVPETDPDSHRMHTRNGFHCCFNVQTAVDTESHLICEYELTDKSNDMGQLTGMAKRVRKILSADKLSVVADKGYDSKRDIQNTLLQGILPNVPMRNDEEERVFSMDYRQADITDKMKASAKPADIRKCLSAGIAPDCLEGAGLSVSIKTAGGAIACFKRTSEKTVLCPMNKILYRLKRRRDRHSIFKSHAACRGCENRCTASSNPKEVCFVDGVDYVPAYLYGKSEQFNRMPEEAFRNQHNRALHSRKAARKVVIKIKYDEEMTRKRMCTVEHPFGSVKWYGDAGYVLCRGKRKASAEIGLSFLSYNMKRTIKMVGVKEMIRKIGE